MQFRLLALAGLFVGLAAPVMAQGSPTIPPRLKGLKPHEVVEQVLNKKADLALSEAQIARLTEWHERVADEPDDAARIAAVYKAVFGRAPTAAEVTAGREFLKAEALKQYDERKAKAAADAKRAPGDAAPADDTDTDEDKDKPTGDGMPAADGMMAGVVPGAKPSEKEADKMRPITTFGRYVKVLLSSNEFLFVS